MDTCEYINLLTTFGDPNALCTILVRYLVVEVNTSYNILMVDHLKVSTKPSKEDNIDQPRSQTYLEAQKYTLDRRGTPHPDRRRDARTPLKTVGIYPSKSH
ncbi:hypothetical protein CR513_17055, partial [Mucuna pruriens]